MGGILRNQRRPRSRARRRSAAQPCGLGRPRACAHEIHRSERPVGVGLWPGNHRWQTVLHRCPRHRCRRGGSLHRGRSRRTLHAGNPAGAHPELDPLRAKHHPYLRRRQGTYRIHRTDRQGSGTARRHDPDHRGTGNRGSGRQRRLLGGTCRRWSGDRQRVRPSCRQAGRRA